jgi:hypothetical protein
MRTVILFAVVFCLPTSAGERTKKETKKRNPAIAGYVKVEIKGKLAIGKKLNIPWKQINWSDQGARIIAPGNYDAAGLGGALADALKGKSRAFQKGWPDNGGLSWALYFGGKKQFYELAKKLRGKTVIVTGMLVVRERVSFSGPGPISPLLLLKVENLKAAPDEK